MRPISSCRSVAVVAIWILYILCNACSWKTVHNFHRVENANEIVLRSHGDRSCVGSENYIPWERHSPIAPKRTIRVIFHFMNSKDGQKNLQGDKAVQFAHDLLASANHDLRNNQPMRLPLHNTTPVLDPLFQYELENKADGTPGIYEHYDDEFYYLVKKGPYKNNYDRSVIDRFGIDLDSILNIFVQVPPPDTMMVDNYGGLKTGVALRNAIRISGPLLTDARVWSYAGMFNHEVGHILGLGHSWVRDQCEDTPEHTNCWNFTNDGSACDSLVSNNIMDSNAEQDAFTPCQIGIIQRSLSEQNRPTRYIQSKDFCYRQFAEPLRIIDTVVWCRETDVVSDVIIDKNSVLVISDRVSMPAGSALFIRLGGQLIIKKEGKLENACGMAWKGVFSKTPGAGQVVIEEGGALIYDTFTQQ
ncbi:hypothetical protein KUV50_04095 [Membranicola marinus]|uniref:Peptidase M43 pregnancy-associated plasma-A domain-containing protein n=1 Tax=Membranihabitans marinus TaxID=1227546 RepID=A0A953HS08_9BACT|nr:hypothetical protein [Membranihabitans marinus]MBY5957305.1 hypothetical protein [Membranihabitans marinus]